jgi:hypothetical protein
VTDVIGIAEAKIYNALQAAGVPAYGEPHPVIPDIQVIDRQASAITGDPDKVKIRISYGVPTEEDETEEEAAAGNISLTTSLTTEFEFRDINDELMEVSFVGTSEFGFTISTQYGSADVQRPQLTITFDRTEAELPKATIKDYLGTVNSVAWSGFPAKTWLCSAINAREDKGEFKVSYTFVYNEKTWMLEILAGISELEAELNPIDPETNNGYAIYDVYQLRDFNTLGLSF